MVAGTIFIIGIVGSLLTYRMNAPEPISEERVIDNNQLSVLDIDTDNVGVNIYPSQEDTVKITLEGEASTNIESSLVASVEDSTLFITYNDEQRSWFNFDLFHVFKPLILSIYVPEKQYELLKVSSDNGYVSAEQLNIEQVVLNTDNGRVELEKIDSQKVDVETNNGRMELKDIMAQTIQVKTDNGKVTLDHVEGVLKGETNNGSISLLTKELERNISFKTNNGKIVIETEKEPTNVQFNVIANNGKVNILDKYQGSTTVGNGENLIELTINNGSITVR